MTTPCSPKPNRSIVAAALLTAALVTAGGTDSHAQFSPDEQKCRATIAKSGSKLAGAVGKAITACHKNRNGNKVPQMANCNAINAESDPKNKVSKTADKLRSAVGGAKDKCSGLVPADLDYHFCPAHCTDEVGTITTFSDVAECIVCLVEDEFSRMTIDTLGSPSSLGTGTPEGKCHGTIGKEHTKLLGAVLKNRTKCQGSAEKKEGAIDTTACSGALSKVDDATAKADGKVQSGCGAANLPSLDSCDAAGVVTLAACLTSAANTTGDTLFQRFYTLGDVGGTTTTTSSTTTTSTTSTTMLTAMAWTEIQSLFSTRCTTCHTFSAQAGLTGLNDCNTGYANTVNAPATQSAFDRIEPFDSTTSYLMHKLDGTQLGPPAGGTGNRMPASGGFLDDTTLDRIRLWINEGAVNDCP